MVKKISTDKFINFSLFKKKKELFDPKEFAIVTGGCGRIGSIYTSLLLLYGLNVIVLSRTKENFLQYSANLNPEFKKKNFWKKLDLRKGLSIEKISSFLKKKKMLNIRESRKFG